jgi:hypothetical protein
MDSCLPAPPQALKKHRARQQVSKAVFLFMSVVHFGVGAVLSVKKCPFGWHVIGFTLVSTPPSRGGAPLNLQSLRGSRRSHTSCWDRTAIAEKDVWPII